jgi:hypothetical protein
MKKRGGGECRWVYIPLRKKRRNRSYKPRLCVFRAERCSACHIFHVCFGRARARAQHIANGDYFLRRGGVQTFDDADNLLVPRSGAVDVEEGERRGGRRVSQLTESGFKHERQAKIHSLIFIGF